MYHVSATQTQRVKPNKLSITAYPNGRISHYVLKKIKYNYLYKMEGYHIPLCPQKKLSTIIHIKWKGIPHYVLKKIMYNYLYKNGRISPIASSKNYV